VQKWKELKFATPGEIARDIPPKMELGVEKHISWADLERDTSCWLGNALQHACFSYLERLEAPAKESLDRDLLDIWRILGLSDHLYYIFTHGGGPGEVHSYFSPYGNPYDAAVTYFSVLSDLHYRLKRRIKLADEPFKFSPGHTCTRKRSWSLEACIDSSEVDMDSIEYHNRKGDLSSWARFSLGDEWLAEEMEGLRDLEGKALRERLLEVIGAALKIGR
jgi:alpha-amylase